LALYTEGFGTHSLHFVNRRLTGQLLPSVRLTKAGTTH
jgi:hypothetical protein